MDKTIEDVIGAISEYSCPGVALHLSKFNDLESAFEWVKQERLGWLYLLNRIKATDRYIEYLNQLNILTNRIWLKNPVPINLTYEKIDSDYRQYIQGQPIDFWLGLIFD